jgi:hypothetical protein
VDNSAALVHTNDENHFLKFVSSLYSLPDVPKNRIQDILSNVSKLLTSYEETVQRSVIKPLILKLSASENKTLALNFQNVKNSSHFLRQSEHMLLQHFENESQTYTTSADTIRRT